MLSVGDAVWLHSSRSRPGSAFGISKGVKHIAVETAQNVSHKIDRVVVDEISSVNSCAGDVRLKKLEQSTSQTLSVGDDASAKGG